MNRWIVMMLAVVALVVVTAAPISACDCLSSLVAQAERSRVDVDEVWPFWVTLSGLVIAIGTLSLWDTRRRRRGPRG